MRTKRTSLLSLTNTITKLPMTNDDALKHRTMTESLILRWSSRSTDFWKGRSTVKIIHSRWSAIKCRWSAIKWRRHLQVTQVRYLSTLSTTRRRVVRIITLLMFVRVKSIHTHTHTHTPVIALVLTLVTSSLAKPAKMRHQQVPEPNAVTENVYGAGGSLGTVFYPDVKQTQESQKQGRTTEKQQSSLGPDAPIGLLVQKKLEERRERGERAKNYEYDAPLPN